MKFTLSQIKKNAFNKPFKFTEQIDISELESMNNDIRRLSSVQVDGECTLDGDEIIFTLTISGEMILPCARTLVDVPYSFTVNEIEVFTTSLYLTKEDEEDEIHSVEGEVLDLTPAIKENVLLAIPYRVFSEDEEVLNNSLFKGDGWELTLEADEENIKQEKTIDPRFKKLQSLLDDNEKEE